MSALRTTSTCRDCGNQIPESLVADALCVRCRYSSKKKVEHLDGDGNTIPTERKLAADAYAFQAYSAVSEPQPTDAPQDDHLDRLIAWLNWLDRGDDRAVLLRVKLIRHVCGKSNLATDTEFAVKYGLSKGRISQLRKEIKSELGRFGNCNNRCR